MLILILLQYDNKTFRFLRYWGKYCIWPNFKYSLFSTCFKHVTSLFIFFFNSLGSYIFILFYMNFIFYLFFTTVCALCSYAWSVPVEHRGGRFNSYARTRLAARTALYLLTHISLRDPQFSFYLCLYLRAIPPLLFYLEISNDPLDTFVLSYSSPGTFISVLRSGCSGSSVLHVLKSALARVIALHLLTLRSSY